MPGQKTLELSLYQQPHVGLKNQTLNPSLIMTLNSSQPGNKLDGYYTAQVPAIFTMADDYDYNALYGTLEVAGQINKDCFGGPKVLFNFNGLFFKKTGWSCFEVTAFEMVNGSMQKVDDFRTYRLEIK